MQESFSFIKSKHTIIQCTNGLPPHTLINSQSHINNGSSLLIEFKQLAINQSFNAQAHTHIAMLKLVFIAHTFNLIKKPNQNHIKLIIIEIKYSTK